MCGITGVIDKNKDKVEENVIHAMNNVIVHRGPDASGVFTESNIGMGHRRLSIVDLSQAGNQPMYSIDERFVLVFNGEIYNYCTLREELEEKGAVFKSATDTEVIIEAYRYWGTKCTKLFNGMWSFVLYDRKERKLFFSRDRFGVKPLYILDTKDRLVYASEIKAIITVSPEERRPDVVQMRRYLAGVEEDADEHTFYQNIHNFPKSCNMVYDLATNTSNYERYWEVNVPEFKDKWKTKNPYKTFRSLLEDSIKIRLQADVEVGASLSGGLDSSAIVGIAHKKYHVKMHTFSSVYKEKNCDEEEFIRCMNECAHTKPHYIYPDSLETLIQDLKDMIYYHDGPCQGASPYSGYCIYRGVGDHVKVLLDGQGADELFGGYIFFYSNKLRELLASKKVYSKIEALKTIAVFQEIWPGSIHFISDEMLLELLGVKGYRYFIKKYRKINRRELKLEKDLFQNDFRKIDTQIKYGPNTSIVSELDQEMNMRLEYKTLPRILHDVDRNSMASSLEVRLPFLDYRLVEFSYTLDSKYKIHRSWTKYIMRKSLKRYLPKKIRTRRNKMGLPAPFDKWLKDERYRDAIKMYLDAFKERNIVNGDVLEEYYQEHLSGKMDRSTLLFQIMSLEIWLQDQIDAEGSNYNYVCVS